VASGDLWEPYWLSGPDGGRVGAVSEYVRDLQAAGRPVTTQRSYALALLRWFRFTWAVGVPWDQATRAEAGDFCRCLQLADKPGRVRASPAPVPGKRPASQKFAPSTVAHCETVCRSFYAYHLEAGTRPIVNPFPLARAGRAHAHHNPMDSFPEAEGGPVPAAGSRSGCRGRSRKRPFGLPRSRGHPRTSGHDLASAKFNCPSCSML
jgi:hypothetical protein